MEDSVTDGEVMPPPLNLMAEEEEKKSGFKSDEKSQEEREEEEEDKVGGSLIRNLMSTTATPKTGETEIEEQIKYEIIPEKKEDDNDEGGRGIFNNIISNLFPQNGDQQGRKTKAEDEFDDDEKKKKVKTEHESNNGNGGGVFENIVSHLPRSIPDDAAPTADEATILINSLVRD